MLCQKAQRHSVRQRTSHGRQHAADTQQLSHAKGHSRAPTHLCDHLVTCTHGTEPWTAGPAPHTEGDNRTLRAHSEQLTGLVACDTIKCQFGTVHKTGCPTTTSVGTAATSWGVCVAQNMHKGGEGAPLSLGGKEPHDRTDHPTRAPTSREADWQPANCCFGHSALFYLFSASTSAAAPAVTHRRHGNWRAKKPLAANTAQGGASTGACPDQTSPVQHTPVWSPPATQRQPHRAPPQGAARAGVPA